MTSKKKLRVSYFFLKYENLIKYFKWFDYLIPAYWEKFRDDDVPNVIKYNKEKRLECLQMFSKLTDQEGESLDHTTGPEQTEFKVVVFPLNF